MVTWRLALELVAKQYAMARAHSGANYATNGSLEAKSETAIDCCPTISLESMPTIIQGVSLHPSSIKSTIS
jgi:hypothetical protein